MAEVDAAEIYDDIFTVDGFWPQLGHIGNVAIYIPSIRADVISNQIVKFHDAVIGKKRPLWRPLVVFRTILAKICRTAIGTEQPQGLYGNYLPATLG